MSMLNVELPADVTPDEARLSLALKLYERQRVPLAAAAAIAGRSAADFLALAGEDESEAVVGGSVAAAVASLPAEDFSDWERR